MLTNLIIFDCSNVQNMATVKFLIQSESPTSSIYARLSIARHKSAKKKTGLVVDSNNWSKKTGFPKSNGPENKKLKSTLQKLEGHIIDSFNKDFAQGVLINGLWLEKTISKHFNQDKNDNELNTVIGYIAHYISNASIKRNAKGGVGLSQSRINDFKSLSSIIESFQGKGILQIKDIDIKFRDQFINWMVGVKDYSKGYAGRMLGNLKTICLDAEMNGVEVSKQIKKVTGFKVKNESIIYLTPAELKKIENTNLSTDSLKNVRKWLLLGCNIGQRGGDLLSINNDNFVFRNGLEVIELKQQKTGKTVTIPVLPKTKEILNDGMPYKISTQKFNKYLKILCKEAKLNELTQGTKINSETKRNESGTFEKWELITSHVCRRSFATNLYGELPTPLIMQITAHATEKTFMGYIGKSSYDYAQQIADFYTKQAIKEKKEPQLNVIKNVSNN
ncbi:Integrase [Galbibacter orientalis DSM 19592]|uniref:Integrase n=1 Tax=Galbibacter orientalis DSM 19592 TaxID=926559 RepID=I3C2E0_9FLAO|nr:tyrosine-type recombinase/integrase [Galbibacter orientalis]EIJ37783.1 Integrase [Galbibacter orientalis DSM 19592]